MKKAELRKLYQQKRDELSTYKIQDYSQLISEEVLALLAGKQISFLHIFLPISTGKEVDTWVIIDRLSEVYKDTTVVLPRIITGSRELEHYIYNPEIPLVENRWGIPEPDPIRNVQVSPERLDVVIIPLLCFDSSGYRVGYGGGYYDRFMAKCKPDVIKIGLSFFEAGPSIEDVDVYDIPLDYVITASNVYAFLS